jgi:AraC-like DNA-binding protein
MTFLRNSGDEEATRDELVGAPSFERTFYPGSTGFVFTAPTFTVHVQLPFHGMVLLSLDGKPIRIRLGEKIVEEQAMAIWSKDVHFDIQHSALICLGINPLHPAFRSFVKIGSANALPLKRENYASLDPLMQAAFLSRRFSHSEALMLFDGLVNETMKHLPVVQPLDIRARRLMQRVCEQPGVTVQELARELHLSYYRTSHLFTKAVGLPFRTYQLWQKLYRAGETLMKGASLTEVAHAAGFVDSAHYSKAFQTAYGRCPTDTFKVRRHIISFNDAFTKASMGASIRAAAESSGSPDCVHSPALTVDELPSNRQRLLND